MTNAQVIAIMAATLWAKGGVDYAEAVQQAKDILVETLTGASG